MIFNQAPLARALIALSLLLSVSACSTQRETTPKVIVSNVETTSEQLRPTLTSPQSAPGNTGLSGNTGATAREIKVSMTVDREAILSEEFFYGADLQHSSLYDESYDLYTQSIAIGHIPARFRIAGNELQLVTDNHHKHPSDVNTPEQLLTRFRILAQTPTTLTISGADSRLLLGQVFKGADSDTEGNLFTADAPPVQDLWIRSIDPEAIHQNYILQETSIVDAQGHIAEFMESIFPRSNLKTGDTFRKIKLGDDEISDDDQELAERFRFIDGEKIFVKETNDPNREKKAAKYAQHFDISDGKTIDWYVTPNIPDEYLDAVKQGVEGWNRYFRDAQEIKRDVVLFKGRLPNGVKLGDPRYNVINWDTREEAGAAYESQASDPFTGRQSHSLIYLPMAWVNIGTDYWTNAQYSEAEKPANLRAGLGRVSCSRDLRSEAAIALSGRLSRTEVRDFGKELLRGTLFHEVGHALGLAHNFKGSLSYDLSQPAADRIFSSSIMDYNNYEVEKQAFDGLNTANGPKLEYDRQILSAIYNDGADIASSDAVMPACADDEADIEKGGVDPLCMRYDVEKDPTQGVVTAFKRVNEAQIPGDVTLADAIKNVPEIALLSADLEAADSQSKFKRLGTTLNTALRRSLTYHYGIGSGGGSSAIRRTVINNLKSLKEFQKSILPDEYNETGMRERAFKGVSDAIALESVPAQLEVALETSLDSAEAKLRTTPYLQSLSPKEADTALALIRDSARKLLKDFATDSKFGLPLLRQSVLANMTRSKNVPYFLGDLGQTPTDIETAFVSLLADAAKGHMNGGSASVRTSGERKAAVASLLTFKGRHSATASIEAVKAQLETELAFATTNTERELFESMLSRF